MNKILIVDDDPLILRMYQRKLSDDGYEIDTAIDGEVAIARAETQNPDLILLDILMPKMNGLDALRALKVNPKTKNIPVIILTNLGDNPKDVEIAKKAGALDYIVKADTSLKDLSTRVGEILKKK